MFVYTYAKAIFGLTDLDNYLSLQLEFSHRENVKLGKMLGDTHYDKDQIWKWHQQSMILTLQEDLKGATSKFYMDQCSPQ